MSKLFVDEIQPKTTGGVVGITGHVLQVKYFQLTTSQITPYPTTNTDMAIPNFTVNITPKSTSSIIKLEANIMFESANTTENIMWFFYRNTTKLGNTQPSSGSRKLGISPTVIGYSSVDNDSTPEFATLTYFDTPSSTSSIDYKLGVTAVGTSNLFINRTGTDTDTVARERGVSFISVTEIGG